MDNDTKFTFSQIRYILWLHNLSHGEHGVKNVELATALGVSKPSVHNMLKSLAELGVVKQETFGLAFFTDEGLKLAKKYSHCYLILEKKLSEVCGSGSVSENAICVLLSDMPYGKVDELYGK